MHYSKDSALNAYNITLVSTDICGRSISYL